MNTIPVPPEIHSRLLALYHPVNRPALKDFTSEELYYAYRLMSSRKPKREEFRNVLASRLIAYIRDPNRPTSNPFSLGQYELLSEFWRDDYVNWLVLNGGIQLQDQVVA